VFAVLLAAPKEVGVKRASEDSPWFAGSLGPRLPLTRFGEGPRSLGEGLPRLELSPAATRGVNATPWQLATVIVFVENGFGSGAIISPDGWILTNYHVVAPAAQTAAVLGQSPVRLGVITCRAEGNRVRKRAPNLTAVLYRTDPQRDLALLKIDELPPGQAELPHFGLAETEIRPGEDCFVVGSQGGGMPWAIRTGQVAGVYEFPAQMTDFLVYERPEQAQFERNAFTMIVSNCPISGGDSGGPLLNARGELVGLTMGTPSNMSQGSLGYHVNVSEIRRFIGPMPRQEEGTPFDPWTAGLPQSIKSPPLLIDFEAEGRTLKALKLVHFLLDTRMQPEPLAEEIFFDFRGRFATGGDAAGSAPVLPSGLWGMEGRGGFKFDLFLAVRPGDGVLAAGYAGKEDVVDEVRIDCNGDRAADVTWKRGAGGLWFMAPASKGESVLDETRLTPLGRTVAAQVLNGISMPDSAGLCHVR
jgi:S1-C subfamily serine protease